MKRAKCCFAALACLGVAVAALPAMAVDLVRVEVVDHLGVKVPGAMVGVGDIKPTTSGGLWTFTNVDENATFHLISSEASGSVKVFFDAGQTKADLRLVVTQKKSVKARMVPNTLVADMSNGGTRSTPQPVGGNCTEPAGNCQNPDQLGHGAGGTVGSTSDANPGAGFAVADTVTPTADGSITGVCWYGFYVDFGGPADCGVATPGDGGNDFTITYYGDGGTVPDTGNVLGSFSVGDGTPVLTGNTIATGIGPINEWGYTATHAPLAVTGGECIWIEIVNNTTGACFWLWSTAPAGDNRGAQDAGAGYAPTDFDQAFCLDVAIEPDGCGAPPVPGCGDPAAGDCCQGNGTPNCDDQTCCETVCACDAFCCDTEWDDACATGGFGGSGCGAGVLCPDICSGNPACPGDGSCFESNGSPGCDDEDCCNIVCLLDSFCCDVTWDGICASGALANCDLPPGGCCVPGDCIDGTTDDECAALGGLFLGFNTTCAGEGAACPAGADNDDCDTAGSLSIPGNAMGSTSDAFPDAGAGTCGTDVTAPGVWYSFTGTGGRVRLDTCSANTNYDTKLNVYCAGCSELNCVTGNDDFCGLQSGVEICTQAGAEYNVLVQGFGGATGDFELVAVDLPGDCNPTVQCLPTGQCCNLGECTVTDEPSCDAAGGIYGGDGTDCSGGAAGSSYDNNGALPLAIVDNTTQTHTINVPDSIIIGDVDVNFDITHTWVGDLTIEIEHVNSGTSVVVLDNPCGNGDNYDDVTLSDGEATNIQDECGNLPVATGSFAPANPLSAFAGLDSASDWNIHVSDGAGGDAGTLDQLTLTFFEEVELCPPFGACCRDEATCELDEQSQCEAGDGVYIGDGTECPDTDQALVVSDSPALAIPDNSPMTSSSTINVADSFSITDVNVQLDISHTWVGDLEVQIQHPDNTVVDLVLQPGDATDTDGSPFGCSDAGGIVGTFDDQGGDGAAEDQCPFANGGSWVPTGALSALDGKDSAGVWTILVRDTAAGDTGTLNSWGLEFEQPSGDLGDFCLVFDRTCCLPDGSCGDIPFNECEDQGGTIIGDPGQCEGDADNDGTDGLCGDNCPNDPGKLEPGICGCGVSDNDADSDGVPDCNDGCPNDPLKTSPGACGCGVQGEGDSDMDTVADCNDVCDGLDDTIDLNNDGEPDCLTPASVPTVSEWGLAILALLLLVAGKVYFGRRNEVTA